MKIARIRIRNLFGITECDLSGQSIELTGPKGAGKTSVLDSIRFALQNQSDRDYIIHKGADEGEILIETDTGLSIERKTRTAKSDSIRIKEGTMLQTRPAEFLSGIFTPLQLNPTEFATSTRQAKNRQILNLIEFEWNLDWIKEKFGEIPNVPSYDKHILEVLADIQAESGEYYQKRQAVNSQILHQTKSVDELAHKIPNGYEFSRWDAYETGTKYAELSELQRNNSLIEKARAFAAGYQDKVHAAETSRDLAVSTVTSSTEREVQIVNSQIERLREQIRFEESKIPALNERLKDKLSAIASDFAVAKAKIDSDNAVALEWDGKQTVDTGALESEIEEAERMKKFLNEYQTMVSLRGRLTVLQEQSDEYTRKIKIARELPGEILETATIPIEGLTVKDGIPLINGLPISNLSDGELLSLCIDVTISKPGTLRIILIDGAERLDTSSRTELYQKCRDKGLQIIATRVTDSDDLEVVEL